MALMIALPLSSAIGTWISIGGSYYLNSVAFPAANLYVSTRFIGGLVITLIGGVVGFVFYVAFSGRVADGIVFFLYFVALTTYLSLMAVLSCYQYLGSAFQNGRTAIFKTVLILAVAPVLTILLPGNDTIIYLVTLYIFLGVLIFGARSVGAKWVTWYHKITAIDDKKLKEWYVKEKGNGSSETFSGMTDPAALVLARGALLKDVEKERKRMPWIPASTDALVLKLAQGWDATIFLLVSSLRVQPNAYAQLNL